MLGYHKLSGPAAVDVPALLDGLRVAGDLTLVGAAVRVAEAQGRSGGGGRLRAARSGLPSGMRSGGGSLALSHAGSHGGGGGAAAATAAARVGSESGASTGSPPPSPHGAGGGGPRSLSSFSRPGSAATTTAVPRPAAEVAVQVAAFAPSEADQRKLYIHTGTGTLRLRAESVDDRWVWLEALREAKAAWLESAPPAAAAAAAAGAGVAGHLRAGSSKAGHPPAGAATTTPPPALAAAGAAAAAAAAPADVTGLLSDWVAAVADTLPGLDAPPSAVAWVTDDLLSGRVAPSLRALAAAEAGRRAALLARVSLLEDAKRQLETELVVERELANSGGGGGWATTPSAAARPPPLRTARSGGGAPTPLPPLAGLASPGTAGDSDSSAGGLPSEDSAVGGDSRRHAAAPPRPAPPPLSLPRPSFGGGGSSLGEDGGSDVFFDAPDGGGSVRGALPPAEAAVAAPGPVPAADVVPPPPPPPPGSAAASAATAAATAAASTRSAPSPLWLAAATPPTPLHRRAGLPRPAQREKAVSLWSIIKECVGKDLTRICLPVFFNEPLSALQKTAEDMEYSDLLDTAAGLPPGSAERLITVAAFAVSAYSGTRGGRTCKPFNPLLGETYELVCPEKGFRFVSEKVVHHPTVIAAHAQGRGWTFQGDADVKSKFWGRSIELTPVGTLRLAFTDGEAFTWSKVATSINNLIIGKIYVDHGGVMRVRSSVSGHVCRLKFREAGLWGGLGDGGAAAREVSGEVVYGASEAGGKGSRRGVPAAARVPGSPTIAGKWDAALVATYPDGSARELWRVHPPPPDPTRYCLTSYALALNEVTPLERDPMTGAWLAAPTDCRLRPDQHHLELGQYDTANAEKLRLETKQRAARKAADCGEPLHPRWFAPVAEGVLPGGEGLTYTFSGEYWACRDRRDFAGCRDIFGPEVEGGGQES